MLRFAQQKPTIYVELDIYAHIFSSICKSGFCGANHAMKLLWRKRLIEILLIYYKKPGKLKVMTIVGGILCVLLLFGGYLLNCNLIVSVAGKENPISVHANGWATDLKLNLNREQQDKLVSYCETLQPVSAEQEKKLESKFYSNENIVGNSLLIWITYPKKYGHNYDYMVCVYDNMIFVRKGYNYKNRELVTFFQDNGLLSFIAQMELIKHSNS
jgi:hypothetical protein